MSGMEMSCLSRPLHYFGGYMIKRRENNWGNRNLRLNTLILYDFCFLVPAKPSKRHKAYLSMFPLILNVKQFDGAWSWQVVVQVVLAPVCVLVYACNAFIHPPPPLWQSVTHIWTPCKREGPSILVSPAPGKGWGLQAPAITLAHLSKVHPSPPPNLCPPPRLSLPQLPLFSPPPLLGLDRCCGVVGLAPPFPTDWEEDGGSPGGWILPHTTPAH